MVGGSTDKKTDEAIATKKRLLPTNKVTYLIVGGLILAVVVACSSTAVGMGKAKLMQQLRDILSSMQTIRQYGPLGWIALVLISALCLILCLPCSALLDAAIGNIYGVFLGTVASLLAELLGALCALFIGRRFAQVLGLELPDSVKVRMASVRTSPFTCLLLARMAPCTNGLKNYAFALLPKEDVPLPQYSCAVVACPPNVFLTVSIMVVAGNADSLVAALDQVLGGL
jgi:uncharacterized membrane protein YdjX (TVP38/TMEM64 family)